MDSRVLIPASESLGGMSALTLESWVYMESFPTPWVPITPHATSTGTPFEVAYGLHYNTGSEVPGGGFRAHVGTSANSPRNWFHLDIQEPLLTNTWYHVAQVYDGSNLIVYLDGEEIGRLTGLYGTVRQVFDPVIGRAWLNKDGSWTPGRPWCLDGLMDEVAIWDIALTPETVREHYLNGLEGKGYCDGTPAEAVQILYDDVLDLDIPAGTENSLLSKLDAALQSLENGNENAAGNILNAFIQAVSPQSGKMLTVEQAEALIAAALEILDDLES
jgi:hypothetical protein